MVAPGACLVGAAQSAPDGEALYQKTCARCHDAGVERAPNRAALKLMSPENIRLALVSGSMSEDGVHIEHRRRSRPWAKASRARDSPPETAADPGLCTACRRPMGGPVRQTILEWLGRGCGPASLSTGRDGADGRRSGPEAETEVGLCFSRCFPNLGATDRGGRPHFRWQRKPEGLLARRTNGMHYFGRFDADVPVRTGHHHRQARCGLGGYFAISAPTLCGGRADRSCCGRPTWTITRWRS